MRSCFRSQESHYLEALVLGFQATTFYNDFVAAIQLYRDNRDWVFASWIVFTTDRPKNGFQVSDQSKAPSKHSTETKQCWADGVDIGEIGKFVMEETTIQEEQRPLRRRVAGVKSRRYDDRQIRDGELEKERKKLTDRLTTWLEAQATFMPDCWENVAKSKASDPENEKLILPSDLGAGNRMRLGLEFLAEEEPRLHQAHGIDFIARPQYISWTINALNDRKIVHYSNGRVGEHDSTRWPQYKRTYAFGIMCWIRM
ncbi:hypothetical protein K435DRAFT_878181 [Dendrothele bispora CBS 962.96]|uniref:Uncharacterized protein n=1 Tax=Dendrothele bispora (strain CBS 962.96) TaxID=1314807 RepID=A0A4V4HAY1_DENBC|nr:hypothetical protein K435DRAFT_878181 [Dendrothele bispora CBS 962.96]